MIILSISSRTMCLTWRVNKEEEGNQEQVVELEGELELEMVESKNRKPVGVPSSAQTRSSEQLCLLVRSKYF